MDLLFRVIEIVAPVFVLSGVGLAWVRLGFSYDVAFVTRLAMTLSLPCLIFVALMQSEIDPAILRDTALASVVSYAAIGAMIWLLLIFSGLEMRTFWAPVTFGNTGNLGLPVALFAFGAPGLEYAVVIFAVMIMFAFTLGIWVVAGSGSVTSALKEPMVWATLLGGWFLVAGWETPRWATNTLELIGQIGIPLMLITLGVAISRLRPGGLGLAVVLSAIKLAICIAVPLAVGSWLGLGGIPLGVLVLQVSTPVAVTSFMLAEKFGARSDEVAGLVVVSTLMSVLAIPATLAFFI